MRRIYESRALTRDEDDPFTPGHADGEYTPQSARSITASTWSDRLVPHAIRRRSVSVSIQTPRVVFATGEVVPFSVHMRNALPIPITLRTDSPVLWRWQVDGLTEAAEVLPRDPPDESGRFRFERGERKRFNKQWSQRFRVTERRWRPADPGEYTLRAEINVGDPDAAGLVDETTIRIRE